MSAAAGARGGRVYLDWNATAPLSAVARGGMEPWLGVPANPNAAHAWGREAALAVDEARARVGAVVGAPREAVVFTSGATEANATALSRGRWLASAVEHPSVRAWAGGEIPVDRDGRVDLQWLADHLHEGWDGVAVQLANHETGVLQPLAEVARLVRAAGLPLHVDAAQALGRVPVEVDCDTLALSAHKAGGPTGVGALVVRRGEVWPLLRGGPQERGRRAGTSPVAAIVGFAAVAGGLQEPALRDRLEPRLAALGGEVVGSALPRLPNTTCVRFEGLEAADLAAALDLEGFAVSVGAACASGSPERSPVLRAMGIPGSALRVSTGPTTTPAELDAFVTHLERVLHRVRG